MEPVKLTPEQWSKYLKLSKGERFSHNEVDLELLELGIFKVWDITREFVYLSKSSTVECKLECLHWRRESNGKLYLYVFENNKWVRYTEAQYYVPDVALSTNSGFATAQKYLQLGYTYKQTKEAVTDE